MDQRRKFIPLTDWHKFHPWPSTSALRHMVFRREINGFSKVVKRAGRRILIDEQAFFQWMNER